MEEMREGIAPALVPLAPALYLAWADGRLTDEEIHRVRTATLDVKGLDDETRSALEAWLDPARPPDAERLRGLLDLVRTAGPRMRGEARVSLANLGEELARTNGGAAPRPALREALETLEAALGVAGGEAARSLLTEDGQAAAEGAPVTAHAFDPGVLRDLLDPTYRELRADLMRLLASDALRPVPGEDADTTAFRARTLERCRFLAARGYGALGFPAEFGGRDDVGAAITAFETLAYGDTSLLVKFGVQFGLFGGSVWQLGTRHHHVAWLADIASLALPGCFAMTETGHGSNVRDIRTTARYDAESDEFVVHTPDRDAWKDYIGNAALHGRAATVFAQLEVRGQRHGVHAFVVPIRDGQGQPLPGISIEDCGRKHGLNGVDNGRIAFEDVRIPRENLLDRFGGVRPDGSYASDIASPARRFFTMLGTLVAGRVSIAAASVSAAKTGLAIAVRYADRRRQFGPEGAPEVPILDYLTMQRRLLPRIASAIALDFALHDLVGRYAGRAGRPTQEMEGLAAGFKAYASAFCVDTLDACRQACGGQGYLSTSRLPSLIADTDIFTTFEGANTVLFQLVTKGLLSGYREQFGELNLWGVMRYVGSRAAGAVTALNPVTPRRTDASHLRDPDFHASALRWREDRLLSTLARRLKRRIDDGEDSFEALNACQDHAVALARAHVERMILERLHEGIARCDDARLRPVLDLVASLHGLACIENDIGWFLEKDYVESAKAAAIRTEVNALCGEVRPHAVALVDGFGIDPALLPDIAR